MAANSDNDSILLCLTARWHMRKALLGKLLGEIIYFRSCFALVN